MTPRYSPEPDCRDTSLLRVLVFVFALSLFVVVFLVKEGAALLVASRAENGELVETAVAEGVVDGRAGEALLRWR